MREAEVFHEGSCGNGLCNGRCNEAHHTGSKNCESKTVLIKCLHVWRKKPKIFVKIF